MSQRKCDSIKEIEIVRVISKELYMEDGEELQKRLSTALSEVEDLRKENAALRRALALSNKNSSKKGIVRPQYSETPHLDKNQKIRLFQSLFHGREDVYALRWESAKGVSGYSPVHYHKDDTRICRRPRKECEKHGQRIYMPLTNNVIHGHLVGRHVIGIYPLLQNDNCHFLAIDFDKKSWQKDIAVFLQVCVEEGVYAYAERSRSGKGAHIWIFFQEAVPAQKARNLGVRLLSNAATRRYQIGIDSYDRMFPSQDLLPKGGFGNLIALPLQGKSREEGNSVFLDDSLQPASDQWQFLTDVNRVSEDQLDALLTSSQQNSRYTVQNGADAPEVGPSSLNRSNGGETVGSGTSTTTVMIHSSNLLFLDKKQFPSRIMHSLIECASFNNPEYYKAQRMRLSVYGKPRIISCVEESERYLGIPRGCLDAIGEILHNSGVQFRIDDKRFQGESIDTEFLGELREYQQTAFRTMQEHEIGVLSAPTAFGKTIIALKMIAYRKVNTLILVHRNQIADHWRQKLVTFLSISEQEIGTWVGGKKKLTGIIDIGSFQSLVRRGEVQVLVENYGQIIIDECHHIPAFSFEQVMKKVKSRFVLGLTATPVRRDGHHPIIYMQCGPIRFKSTEKKEASHRPFEHVVLPRITAFRLDKSENPKIHEIYNQLLNDNTRNGLIVQDVKSAFAQGHSVLVLSERKAHLTYLYERLSQEIGRIFYLHGTLKKKQTQEVMQAIQNIPKDTALVLLATGRFIGEGFDEPRLDTLFLTLPISWRGTLQQYAGRLHRNYDNKKKVTIYDYVDSEVGVLNRMYEKRLRGYKSIGYRISEE